MFRRRLPGQRGNGHRDRSLRLESLEERLALSTSALDETPSPLSSATGSGDTGPGTLVVPEFRTSPLQQAEATPEWIARLSYREFPGVPTELIHHLSEAQLSSIPNDYWLSAIPSEARDRLTVKQVRAINVAAVGLRSLSLEQVGFLSITQIQSIDFDNFKYLTAGQVIYLSPQQIASIPSSGTLNGIPESTRAAMTRTQIQALDTSNVAIALLTPEQIEFLTVAQIRSIDVTQFKFLGPHEIVHLTSAQVAQIPDTGALNAIPIASRAALTESQVQALDVSEVGLYALTERQIDYLTSSQITSVDYTQFKYLGPDEINLLTTAQVATIPSVEWLNGIPVDSRAALTRPQTQALNVSLLGLSKLTSEQVKFLTIAQVRSIDVTQFNYLGADEIIYLTPGQVATISHTGTLNAISSASRARLTELQVQALKVASVGLHLLTGAQIGYLTPDQIRSVDYTQFKHLGPDEIAYLTPAQVASIPNVEWLNGISVDTRAALTRPQIQALNVGLLGISKLTSEQIESLLPTQISSLYHTEFKYLGPNQIVQLKPAQIAMLPNTPSFNAIPSASRAALTVQQVRALNVAAVEVELLTGRQITYLLPAQVAVLDYWEFYRLSPPQIGYLTNAQMASIPSVAFLRSMTVESQLALTRAQRLSLRPEVRAQFNRMDVSLAAPSGFIDPLAIPPASDGLAGDQRTRNEANAIFRLVPREAATHVTARNGRWSDPGTWIGGNVPGLDSDVLIASEHLVVFDTVMSQAIHTLRVDGLLSFAINQTTTMLVDTVIVDTSGTLYIGTKEKPIAGDVTARIVFTAGTIDTNWDPQLISRGLSSRGKVRIYGQEVTPYVEARTAPKAGDTQLVLDSVPVNWKPGDELIIAGSKDFGLHEERRTILAIDGNVVNIARLQYDHVPPEGYDFSVHVANVTRNVVFESENPDTIAERGHLMFAHNPDVEIVNAGLYGLGRTDKSIPINDPVVVNGELQEGTGLNRRARYPIHFHRTGVDPNGTPAVVRGNAVVGGPGWGYVNHSSYVVMEDNVAYDVVGAAFASEDGNEIGAFRGNLAIRGTGSGEYILSRTTLHDFGHGGHGFWIQGPGVEVTDNIAAGQRDTAFVFFTASSQNQFNAINLDDPTWAAGNQLVPVGSVPLKTASGNVAYGSFRGLDTWFHQMNMPNGESVIDGFTAWNTIRGGIKTYYTGQLTLRDILVVGNSSSPSGTGIEINRDSHDIRLENVRVEGFDVGIEASVRSSTSIRGGHISAIVGIRAPRAENRFRTVIIVENPIFETLNASQLNGRTQYDVFIDIDPQELSKELDRYFRPFVELYGTIIVEGRQFYLTQQAQNFIPLPLSSASSYTNYDLINKTNQQLWDRYGIAVGGQPAPVNAVAASRINGLLGSPTVAAPSLSLVSPRYTNQLSGYQLEYLDQYGDLVKDQETVDLVEGWNLLVRQLVDQPFTFLVNGDTRAPMLSLHADNPAVINPNALAGGFVLHATVHDGSFGQLSLRKDFQELEQRTRVTRPNGTQFIFLDILVGDLAGNSKTINVQLELDADAPSVAASSIQYVKPPGESLRSQLTYYYLTGQTELISSAAT